MSSKKTIKKTKLIKLLSTFSVLEWKRFGRFVQSPYHNTNSQIITLYTILKKVFPFETSKDLEQERIYKKVYGKEIFNLSKFQNLCSDLYELATDFVVDVHLNKEKWKKKKVVIDALAERNYELFKNNSLQLIREIETQDYFLDGNDFLLSFQLHNNLHTHIETSKYIVNAVNLRKSAENLVAFYEDANIQILAENMAIENIFNKKKEVDIQRKPQLKDLFQMALELHKNKQPDLYIEFKEKVFGNWDKLKIKHQTNLLSHLINFTFTNELIQKKFGIKESFELYKVGARDQLLVINGKMRDIDFLNIGLMGFGLKEMDWTDKFIENHKNYLDGEPSLITLLYAYKANFEKNHHLVIKLLSRLKPKNNTLYLPKIKSLLIRAYFEGVVNGEEEYLSPLNYEMDSFKKMMKRNGKLSSIKTDSYINFINFTKKLILIYVNKNQNTHHIQSLIKLLTNTKPLLFKKWLEEKLAEIKNVAS